jgi:5-formyltetrahydrofolate cyclo-ligase
MSDRDERPGAEKRAIRSELIQARARLSKEERVERSRAVAERALALPELTSARTVALYSPLNTEVDPSEIGRRLASSSVRLVFPRVPAAGRILLFAACDQGALVRGPLGASEPPPGSREVDLADVDAVIMPGVAFSEDGLRLGRGGGYYDSTLKSASRTFRIGLAFDLQLVRALPREPHDIPLHALVTETRLFRFAR